MLGHRDQPDFTQHREELNSLYTGLYTGLYTSLYHIRFISKNINYSAAIGVEWPFVHKVGINKKINKKINMCIAHWFTSLSTLARYDEPGLNLALRIFILHCYQVRPHSSVLR